MTTRPWPLTVGSLLLREVESDDLDRLLAYRNDPAVTRWLLQTEVERPAFHEEWARLRASDTDFTCVVERDGVVVATAFLEIVDGMGQPGMPRGTEAMIGYIVDPACWGQGIASAVTTGLLTAAFDRLGLRRVTAGCYAENRASARVLEKAGMRREQYGVADSWHAELGWVDGCTYAILADEWRARHR